MQVGFAMRCVRLIGEARFRLKNNYDGRGPATIKELPNITGILYFLTGICLFTIMFDIYLQKVMALLIGL